MAKNEDEDFRLFHPLYAISISVGFVEMFRGVYRGWELSLTQQEARLSTITAGCLTLLLLPLAIRFIWAVESLNRFISCRRANDSWNHDVDSKTVTLFHYPALLCHAVMIFLMSREIGLIAYPVVTTSNGLQQFDQHIGFVAFLAFSVTLSLLLIFNALYLYTILPSETETEARDESNMEYDSREIKLFWIRNNLTFGLLIAVITYCSAQMPSLAAHWQTWAVYLCLGINNFLDLFRASGYYVPRH